MRITKIELKGFRIFHGNYEIDLGKKGRNLLVYGENGSGKTSLYQALNLFFSFRKPLPDFKTEKNIFIDTDDNYVKISLGDGKNPDQLFEWSEVSNPFAIPIIIETSKTKGFFDYKSLLETYFLQKDNDNVDIFELLVKYLIANTENEITGIFFSEEWETIQELSKGRMIQRNYDHLIQLLDDFRDGLATKISDLNTCANVILTEFDDTITIDLLPPVISFNRDKKELCTAITLSVSYYKKRVEKHHLFLNESRLSAIALSVYLSSILLNPPSQLKILVLDDVLIGLDMSNRLPLIEVLQKEFLDKGWQVILTTYDRIWYEILCQRLPDSKWARAEFYCRQTDKYDLPIYKNGVNWLEKAKEFIDQGEYKAAVIYVRTGFEHILKNYCDKKKLKVNYHADGKYTVSDFWDVVQHEKLLPANLSKDIELYLSKTLNPMSHSAFVNPIKQEILNALNSVTRLENELGNFLTNHKPGTIVSPRRRKYKNNLKK